MIPGDVVLLRVPEIRPGESKLRPALVLAILPGPYQNLLVCGISTQLQQLQPGWDEMIAAADPDFADSGLHRPSAVRLSFLYSAERSQPVGVIGHIRPERLARLRERLRQRLQM